MPSIPDFNAPPLDIRPTEIGVESTAAAGRRLGVYGSQIAESDVSTGRAIAGGVKSVGDAAEQYAEHQNISSLARHGADVMAAGTQSLNAYFSGADIPDDPNNPNAKKAALDERLNNPAAAKQWLDNTLNPMLESYQQGAWTEGGQQYAQRFAENLRTHLTTSAIADQSTGAGIAAKDNLQKTADGYATAAFNSHNLHDVSGYINAFDHAIGAISSTSPTINADGQARIKEWAEQEKGKIITSAVQGRIMAGGSYDDITKAYPQYVQPGQNAAFERQELQFRRTMEVEARQNFILKKQQAEMQVSDAMSRSWAANVKYNPQTNDVDYGPNYIKDLAQIPVLHPDAPNAIKLAQEQIKTVKQSQAGENATYNDPDVQQKLVQQFYTPGATEAANKLAIFQAVNDKKITPHQMDIYLKMNEAVNGSIKDPVFEAAMKNAQQVLGGDIEGRKQFADFQFNFLQSYFNEVKEGKVNGNTLAIKNPDGTWNEQSTMYQMMKPHIRPPDVVMMNTIMQRAGIPAGMVGDTGITMPQSGGPPKVTPKEGETKQFKNNSTGNMDTFSWKEGVGWVEAK